MRSSKVLSGSVILVCWVYNWWRWRESFRAKRQDRAAKQNRTTEGETTRNESSLHSKLVEVAGVEPASLVLSYAASTCLALSLLSSLNRLEAGYLVSRLSRVQRMIESRFIRYAC